MRMKMQLLYNLVSITGLVFYLPLLLLKKGPEKRSAFIKERLGMGDYHKTDIWVHAVSVGETLAILPFLKKLKKDFPGKKITLTTTTYTGQKIAREKFPEADRIMYMPLDTVVCVKRVVNLLRPAIFITVETELWPALFQALKKTGSRIIILNGRISNESFRGYRKIKFIMKDILSNVDFFYMQEKIYADRIIHLGADRHKVGIMGNFKFDINFEGSPPLNWLNTISGKILLAASTHKGEEEIILDAYDSVRNKFRDIKLVLAPRHPERFSEVEEILKNRRFKYVRRTEIQYPEPGTRNPDFIGFDIILLDTIGELSGLFSKAAIAFIGGSLVPAGGHNILEPAYWSRPVICGPHMDNFPITGEFLKMSAALEVKDSKDMAEAVTALLENNEKASDMGQNARAIVDKNRGAVKKAMDIIRGYIGTV
ncbi:MAG TPA: 3-deoxy-D-manno-octulosonic acid transferase [Nitrospirae bacterium]|nr:3-deoxy-D-manno-octulosonic acid transferase [Nitrospirota bacterium]